MSITKKSTELHGSKVMPYAKTSKDIMTNISECILKSLLLASFSSQLALAASSYVPTPPSKNLSIAPSSMTGLISSKPGFSADHPVKSVNFEQETASPDARQIADWVINSNNNTNLPFVIVDKTNAKTFAFTPDGHLIAAAPILLGLSRADYNVPGIGSKKLSAMQIDERTTPAGRFVAYLDKNLRGEEILWVDYATSVAMHRVHTHNKTERRGERIASPTIADNRISYGCINVPVPFYLNVISKTFHETKGIVYILPETRPLSEIFGTYGFVANNKVASSK